MWLVYIQFLFGNEMPEKQTMLTVFFRGSSMFLFVGKWTKTSPVCVAKYSWFSHVFNIFLWCLRGDIHGKPWRVVFGLSRSFFRGWFCSCWRELCVFQVIWHSPFVVASCINSWRIIASGIRIDLEGKNFADWVPRFLNSKMSSSITHKESVQTLNNDWSTWSLTNEPHLKNKALVRACWPLFSLKKAGYWIKHWNPGSFPNASHLLRRTCKAQVLGSGEKGLTESKLAAMRVVSEEMAVGNAIFDKDDSMTIKVARVL